MQEHVLYECGICDCLHPWDFDGDCRDNANRYPSSEDYAERYHIHDTEIEVRSWQDRLDADREIGLTSFQETVWIDAIKTYGPAIMDKSMLSQEQRAWLLEKSQKGV